MVYIIVQLRKQLENCEEIWRDWSSFKYWKACALSCSFRWKYLPCKWKSCRRPECVYSSSLSGIRTVLRHIMAYFSFFQLTQQLKPADHLQRCRYVKWMIKQQAVDGYFSNKIFSSDEAYFTLCGYVNKQNCRIWVSKNPQVIEERLLHSEKFTVWRALWSECVIVPYFLENYEFTTVTVNSERYVHMITDFFVCYWRICDFNKTVPHATQLGWIWLYCKRRVLATWAPRSCDFTPRYADKPSNLEYLKTNIRQVVTEIPPNMCQKVVENYLKRINASNASRGDHLNAVVFQT